MIYTSLLKNLKYDLFIKTKNLLLKMLDLRRTFSFNGQTNNQIDAKFIPNSFQINPNLREAHSKSTKNLVSKYAIIS